MTSFLVKQKEIVVKKSFFIKQSSNMTLSYGFFSRKNVISCFFEGITKNYHTNDKNFS